MNSSSNFTCAICLQQAQGPPVVTPCGHIFCWQPCLTEWANARGRRTVPCPVCAGSVCLDSDLTPIYGAGDDRTSGPPSRAQQNQQQSASQAASAGGASSSSSSSGAAPPPPPPRAHRRNEAAPPPANNNNNNNNDAWLQAGGLGFMPLMFVFMGGGDGNSLGDMIPTMLIGLGVSFLLYHGFNYLTGRQHLNHNNNNGPVALFNNAVRIIFNVVRVVFEWIRAHATAICWIVVIVGLMASADLWSGLHDAPVARTGRGGGQQRKPTTMSA